MKKWILAAAISAALVGCGNHNVSSVLAPAANSAQLPAGVVLLEDASTPLGQVAIPYKKYQLANGLIVVLHQDKSDPLVHVDVTYHVGSGREVPGRSGFAHLFEHMMFQGSKNVGDEQHFKVVTEAGGTLNGTTNTDRTNYFETVPSNQLEKMLWLESDRMGFFLPALTAEKFEVQRETVKNERGQRVDNQPYGRMYERFDQAFYPAGHPYSWPVIGWPDDLNRATVDDVRSFFKRWYGPNNATLTIGGDFDETTTLALVNKYFGEIPRGPEVETMAKVPVTLDATRYISMEDKVHLPLLRIGFPTVYAGHPDEAALDLLSQILGGGKTSLFYKNLVKDGVAVQAGVGHPCAELSCQLFMYGVANPAQGGKLADVEQRMLESIDEFVKRGVTDEDLQKAKVQFEADTIFGLQSVSGKVAKLAYNQTFFDKPDLIAADLARYKKVTKADVMRVFEQYVQGKPRVVMSIVPEGRRDLIAAADNFVPPPVTIAAQAVAMTVAASDVTSSFDRSLMPISGAAPLLQAPSLWQGKLANGIEVMGSISQETPTTEIIVYLNGGSRLASVEQVGVASLTASLLNESSAKRSTEELTQALELLGASVSFSAGSEQSIIRISALTEQLVPVMAIVEEKLYHPGFNAADFERVKQQTLQGLQQEQADPNTLAVNAFNQLMYGANNPLGVNTNGTIASVTALTLADVKAFYAKQYRAGNAAIVAVTDLDQDKLLADLAGLSGWSGAKVETPALTSMPELEVGTIYVVDKPGAAQSVIRLGKRAMPFDATGDYFKSFLMNYPLGGAFNSRINLNLREDKGYTYGARSYFSGAQDNGLFIAGAAVRADVTGAALAEFIKEIGTYQASGITSEELAFMRSSIAQGEALDYETPYQKAGFVRKIQQYGLDKDFTTQQSALINQVTKPELDKLAKSQLALDEMVIVVVGDKEKVTSQLKALGYPIKQL
ncbi:insulinase family protein [Shewanella sp. SNU WT4]|uniref:M16 family metallopeptidase n=1 Tax=Shewanella sp. SNU WT4 TaxID=2590015 RepID=UPI00112789C2|nr:pitrilysin family protein [Shewanella sp. SNU WT4]QDF67811.1 insulinase family protein [Shewanella sp. SNU WT4]